MAKLSNDAIDWIAGREPNSDGEIKFSVLPEQRDEIIAALRAWKTNLPISIYLVEDDEGFVRLAAEGQLICRVPANGPKGVALLRLNAALKEIRGSAAQSPPSDEGCGTPGCTDPNCEYGEGPLRCQRCGAPVVGEPQTARWRHKKRGTTYTEIGRAKLQASDVGGFSDMQPMVVYRSDNDGSLWVRPEDEFEDGRFEVVALSRPNRGPM